MRYCVYRLKVNEIISGDTAFGDEIRIRILKEGNSDDHPFEEGNDYICFLWDTGNYPAVLLNRSQSQIRLEGNDVYLTEDTYTAMEGTINGLKNSRGISIQAEDISDDLYEDVILKDAKQEILTKIYALSENKR